MRVLVLHQPEKRLKHLNFSKGIEAEMAPVTAPQPGHWDAIMHWGPPPAVSLLENGVYGAHLNPPHAVQTAIDPVRTVQIWRAHGIDTRFYEPARRKRSRIGPRYRFHICDLRILAVYRRRGGKYRLTSPWGGRRMERVRERALQCIYTLGLHFGSIDVGCIGRKHVVPLNLDPTPSLNKRTGKRYAKGAVDFVTRYQERLQTPRHPVVLGADLEFIIKRRKGGLIYASRFFSRTGRIGYDQQSSRHSRRSYPIAEIRPAPSQDPSEIVANIKSLLRRASRRAGKSTRFEAGSLPVRGYPIGGHIHLSRISMTTGLLRALDNYLALPVMMLESPLRARRRRPRYGHLGEFRWKGYGGFEYRTLSSWIVAPHFALAVLSLAKLVADNYESLQRDFMQSPELVRAFYRQDKEALKEQFRLVWADLQGLDDYRKVAEQIEVIPNLVNEEKQWLESRDIRARWGLISARRRKRGRASRKGRG